MKKNILKFSAILAIFLILLSCKKAEVGPQGPKGDSYTGNFKEGEIKATVSDTTADGFSYSYNLVFNGERDSAQCSYIVSPYSTEVSISKEYLSTGDQLKSGYIYINFRVGSLQNMSVITDTTVHISFLKNLGNNKYLSVDKYNNSYYPASTSVSELTYNPNTKIMTGKFSLKTPSSDNKHLFTLTGSFSTLLAEEIEDL